MALNTSVSKVVARRYAKALIDLAVEKKKLPKIEKDLESLLSAIQTSSDFQMLMQSKAVSNKQKLAAVEAIAKKAKWQAEVINFLKVIAQNGRLAGLAVIVEAAYDLMAEGRNEVKADIVTANPVTQTQVKKLQGELSKATGKNIIVQAQVDEKLLGGMQVTIGSVLVDSSIAGRLSRLKTALGKRTEMQVNDNVKDLNKKEA